MAGSKRNVGREREDRGLRAIVESLSGAVKRQDSPALLEALQVPDGSPFLAPNQRRP